jgi:hypothetical protein
MYKNTPEPWELRSMFPDVALSLETQSIKSQLRDDLQLKSSVACGPRNARVRIALNDGHFLMIQPVDQSYGSFEWFTYSQQPDENGNQVVKQSLRTLVTLLKGEKKPAQEIIVSFTTHYDNIEETIRMAMRIIFTHTGQRFTPQVIGHGKNWRESA